MSRMVQGNIASLAGVPVEKWKLGEGRSGYSLLERRLDQSLLESWLWFPDQTRLVF